MNAWQLAIYGITGFGISILSGIAGAGGGFVMTPLAIVLGLTPAQAVSCNKFGGLAVTIGSLSSLRKYNANISKTRIFAIMALAFVIGLIAPFAIKSFDSHWYRLILGAILLLMVPVMLRKRVGIRPSKPSAAKKTLGGFLLAVSLFLQGAFSGGLGSLVNIVLMGMLGQTANEAHLTKRYSQLILNITIIIGVLGAHLIVWPVVAVGVCVNLIGGYIGGHLAVKKGDKFAVDTLLGLMVVSALVLILGAL
jgi:uncharacterized protein